MPQRGTCMLGEHPDNSYDRIFRQGSPCEHRSAIAEQVFESQVSNPQSQPNPTPTP